MKENVKKGKVKGTVLFTIVAVMMVMVVFLMSTLVLATSTHRRTYYSYFETQAQYAAQAALDVLTNYAYNYEDRSTTDVNPDAPFYDWVKTVTIGNPQTVTVNFPDNGTVNTLRLRDGSVQCTVEKIDDVYFWDNQTQQVQSKPAWKITAEAVVGTGMQSATAQVCNYIYDSRTDFDPDDLANRNNYSATHKRYNYKENTTTVPGSIYPSELMKAVTMFSKFDANVNQSGNNLAVFGPYSSGLQSLPVGRMNYNTDVDTFTEMINYGASVGDVISIGNYRRKTENHYAFQKLGEGVSYYGNIAIYNGETSFLSTYTLADAGYPDGIFANNCNYVFVDGTIYVNDRLQLGVKNYNNQEIGWVPVNTYAGSIKALSGQAKISAYGDIFLYESDTDSIIPGGSGESKIVTFTNANIHKTAYGEYDNMGNIFSANGRLVYGAQNGTTVEGSIVYTNPTGSLEIGQNANGYTQVNGNIVCAGTLRINNQLKMNAGSTIYCDAIEGTVPTEVTVRSMSDYDARRNYPTDYVSRMEKYYDEENDAYENLNNSMFDLSYFPFESRLDEVCERYYRWDIKSTDRSVVAKAIGEVYAATDRRIYESQCAGHNWGIEEIVEASTQTLYYVPYTTPTNPENGVVTKPIFKIDIVPGTGADNEVRLGDIAYYDNAAAFLKTVERIEGAPLKVYDKNNLPHLKQQTTCYAHDINGNEANFQIGTNSYYITHSCVLDMREMKPGGENFIFVDPSVEGYHDGAPLVVFLRGKPMDELVNILVNNTAKYTLNSATGTPYVSMNGYAGRGEVIFMFEESFAGTQAVDKLSIVCTGLWPQYKANRVSVVSSPTYPGTAGYDSLGDDMKYKFELMPNVIIYGEKGVNYRFVNQLCLNATVIMPESTIQPDAQNGNTKVYYREYCTLPTAFESPGTCATNCYGVMLLEAFRGKNCSSVVYLADENRPSTGTQITPSTVYDESNASNGQSPNFGQQGSNFNSDHLGAH